MRRMMSAKLEHDNEGINGDSSNGSLLMDIKAISKALYLPKTPQQAATPSAIWSKYAGRSNVFAKNSNSRKDKKVSSIWNWKKPLKALAHIGQHRFNICFFLHVHSIEGLPRNFDDISLGVHWKRKDEILHTRSSKVLDGIAEFEETLMCKCSVYGSRNGPHSSAKYGLKIFLIYVTIVGAPDLDLGKHWVDLTRLLPLTLEELEGEKSSGKWMTSFKLSGKAKGATLNVSFGFSVIRDDLIEARGNAIRLTQNGSNAPEQNTAFNSSSSSGRLRRVGSVPSDLNRMPTQSTLPNLGLELSNSIHVMSQKLHDRHSSDTSARLDIFYDQSEPVKIKPELGCTSAIPQSLAEGDGIEFTVSEKGIEICKQDQCNLEETASRTVDSSAIEIIDVYELFKDEDTVLGVDMECASTTNQQGYYLGETVIDNWKYEDSCVSSTTMDSAFTGEWVPESLDLGSISASDYIIGEEKSLKVTSKRLSKSRSLDDITESVASEFLDMLGYDHDSKTLASESDPESPRERLLREFEEEAQASSHFILDFDRRVEQVESDTVSSVSGCGQHSDDFDLSSIIRDALDELESEHQLLRYRRKAKVLEDLETESLMREWGMNEKSFQDSPPLSNGFGSPIELLPEEPVNLPPLGEGCGPFFEIKGGGCLRSMNPSVFRHVENIGHLIMQVSAPIVLPAEMGSDIMEILQRLALNGIQNLSSQVNVLMPLENITGKTMQQISEDSPLVLERKSVLEHDSYGSNNEARFRWNFDNQISCSPIDGMVSNYVSFKEFATLAVDRIEALLIEGLRIQCGMSDEEAPSNINPDSIDNTRGFTGLADLSLSVTLDEWLRLDSGGVDDKDQINEHALKVLSAHHATNCVNSVGEILTSNDANCDKFSGLSQGFLGGKLTVAFLVLLRDPLRNYEPVGGSMLALFQAERSFLPLEPRCARPCRMGFETPTPWFKLIEVHLAGVNTSHGSATQPWGTKAQQQSGTRWLLANGMGGTNKHQFPSSKAIVKYCPEANGKYSNFEDIFWSITSNDHDLQSKQEELGPQVQHIRNPNVIFLTQNAC